MAGKKAKTISIKLAAIDIDGTLAVGTPGDQYIPESTQYALKQLEAEGHFIAIATGRSYKLVAKTHRFACGMKATYFLLGFYIE